MHLDVTAVAAALLHDAIEDSLTRREDIQAEFGDEVAQVVDGLTKISKMDFRSLEEQQAENFRKMILAMSKDLRVLLIKLVDRLHNMRTLEYHNRASQLRIARETLDIYAPLANRLGIHWLQVELEELSLKFLEPADYRVLKTKLDTIAREKEEYLRGVMDQIQDKLTEAGIKAELKSRIKHIYSVYQKLKRQNIPLENIYASRRAGSSSIRWASAMRRWHHPQHVKPIQQSIRISSPCPREQVSVAAHHRVRSGGSASRSRSDLEMDCIAKRASPLTGL
jgi:GTP pyrophosphokinase